MKFVEPDKTGKVLGNDVKASPVPMDEFRAMQSKIDAANQGGDNDAVLDIVADSVARHVTMADGTPIDPKELSPTALRELYAFLVGFQSEGLSDFTPSP